MAEKETTDKLKGIPSEEGNSNSASKGLSKPTLIKIATGLITLLFIASAAYFFLMSADGPAPEEATVKTSEEVISSEFTPSTSTLNSVEPGNKSPNTSETVPLNKEYTAEDIQILKMREEAVALKEQNLEMKERLSKLERQQEPNIKTTEPAIDATTPEDETKVTEADPKKPKIKTNQYSNLYSRDYTTVREPQSEPPPEPKWGNFDPLYRGK